MVNDIIKNTKKSSEKKHVKGKRYQNVSEEEKDKKQKKVRERYQNFMEEKKEKRCHYYQKR